MSAQNLAAQIGVANTNKIPAIGAYVQDALTAGFSGPGADSAQAIGVNGLGYWASNVMGEAVDGTTLCPANSGAVTGRTAQWVTNTALIAAATTRVNIAAGVATADNATGTHDINSGVGNPAIPANSFFWAFQR
jgi:hypothetical protein